MNTSGSCDSFNISQITCIFLKYCLIENYNFLYFHIIYNILLKYVVCLLFPLNQKKCLVSFPILNELIYVSYSSPKGVLDGINVQWMQFLLYHDYAHIHITFISGWDRSFSNVTCFDIFASFSRVTFQEFVTKFFLLLGLQFYSAFLSRNPGLGAHFLQVDLLFPLVEGKIWSH